MTKALRSRALPCALLVCAAACSGAARRSSTAPTATPPPATAASAPAPSSPVALHAVRVERRDVRHTLDLAATLAPGVQTEVLSPVDGRVTSVLVEPSASVRRGARLAILEPTTREARRAGAQAVLLHAPADGTVLERRAQPGATVTARAPLFVLVQTDTLRAVLPVPEVQGPLAHPGQPVRLRCDAFPDRVFAAVLQRTSAAVTTERTLPAEALLQNNDAALRPGMHCVASIELLVHADVLAVREDSVARGADDLGTVFVREGALMRARPVRLGLRGEGYVEVLAGLTEGATVFAPATGARDGAPAPGE